MAENSNDWGSELALRVGAAVKQLRETRNPKLSVAKLAEIVDELGFSVPAAAIAELERGRKKSVTVAEVIAFAMALRVAPIQLIYPRLPDGEVEAWPGHKTRSILAAQWFSGEVAAFDASDYITEFSPEERDRMHRGMEPIQRSRELEKYRNALNGWATSMAGYELDEARKSGDADAIARARQALVHAERSDAELRKFVVQMMAAMISRGMNVRPAEGVDHLYEEAWKLVHADPREDA